MVKRGESWREGFAALYDLLGWEVTEITTGHRKNRNKKKGRKGEKGEKNWGNIL